MAERGFIWDTFGFSTSSLAKIEPTNDQLVHGVSLFVIQIAIFRQRRGGSEGDIEGKFLCFNGTKADGLQEPNAYTEFTDAQKADLNRLGEKILVASGLLVLDWKATRNFEFKEHQLVIGKRLGRGAFGDVFAVSASIIANSAKPNAALKTIDCSRREGAREMFAKELELLLPLVHDNVVFVYGSYKKESDAPGIVMELMKGSISQLCHILTVPRRLDAICQIAAGLAYLHSKGEGDDGKKRILHRDLKCDNILYTYEGTKLVYKLADFGLSRTITTASLGKTGGLGTIGFKSPEVVRRKESYGTKADVYSFAMVMYQILSGVIPYFTEEVYQPFLRGFDMDYFTFSMLDDWQYPSLDLIQDPEDPREDSTVSQLKDLMQQCWSENPADRPSMEKVVATLDNIVRLTEDNASAGPSSRKRGPEDEEESNEGESKRQKGLNVQS